MILQRLSTRINEGFFEAAAVFFETMMNADVALIYADFFSPHISSGNYLDK